MAWRDELAPELAPVAGPAVPFLRCANAIVACTATIATTDTAAAFRNRFPAAESHGDERK